MTQKRSTTKPKRYAEIHDYDTRDTPAMIDPDKPLAFGDLDLPYREPPWAHVLQGARRGARVQVRSLRNAS
jgi:hypothetical protein